MTQKNQSRWHLRMNQFIGIGLLVFIFFAVNYIGYKYYFRKDISLNTYTQLSTQSLNVISNLPAEVTLVNFATPQGDITAQLIMQDVVSILGEYRYHSKNKIKVVRVDPFINFDEAKRYAELYKVSDQENVIVVDYKGQKKIIAYNELADIDNSLVTVGGAASVRTFKAEKAITSAIQSLVGGKKSKVYFLSGHGEYDPLASPDKKSGYSLLADYIKRQNVEIAQWNLISQGGLPEDMDLLIIAGPTTALAPVEVEIIEQYLERTDKPARLMIMLDPKTQSGLENILKPYGIIFENNLAVTKISIMGQVRLYGEVLGESFARHPVTEWIGKGGVNVNFRSARSLTILKGSQATPLVLSPKTYWGETDIVNPLAELDPEKDMAGPLVVAAAIDKGSLTDGGVKLTGAKIVAVGSASYLINQLLDVAPLDFFLNSMNWMLDKEQSMGISAKQPQEFNVQLSDQQLQTSFLLLISVPTLGLVLGLIIWFQRRK
ncbi:MAG: GldG family protein [Blastochloris sp.]|nr:GldG family protein [Blastochloris sp.]